MGAGRKTEGCDDEEQFGDVFHTKKNRRPMNPARIDSRQTTDHSCAASLSEASDAEPRRQQQGHELTHDEFGAGL